MSKNQGKLEVVKQEVARVNVNILGISELKCKGVGELIQMTLYLLLWARIPQKKYSNPHSQQKSLKCSTWMQSQKQQNDLCSFPRQTIQYHGNRAVMLQKLMLNGFMKSTRPSRTKTPKRCPFYHRELECKSRKSRDIWSNRQIWSCSTEWSRAKSNRILPRECTGNSKHPLPTTQEKTLHMDITDSQHQNQINYILCSWR